MLNPEAFPSGQPIDVFVEDSLWLPVARSLAKQYPVPESAPK
jgi:hypothetical protein